MIRFPVKFDKDLFLHNGVYWYRGTPPFAKNRLEFSLKVKEGAAQKVVAKAKKEKLEAYENRGFVKGKTSLGYLGEKYIQSRELEHGQGELSEKSLWEDRKIIRDYFKSLHRLEVAEINQGVFNEFCLENNKRTLHNDRKVMNRFLKWCVQNNYLRLRPEIELPKFAKKKPRQREILTEDEVIKLFTHLDGPATLYHAMYLLMGMRNSEILKLEWENVGFERQALRVHPMSNKSRAPRAIPMNPWVEKLLRETPRINEYVFPSRTPNGKKGHRDTTGAFRDQWHSALKAAGISRHLTPHDMRATFEYWMHKNTAFTDTQREKMAGANIDVQKNIYVTMDVEALRGLEHSVKIQGLDEVLNTKIPSKNGVKSGVKTLKRGLAND
jgi:integrase